SAATSNSGTATITDAGFNISVAAAAGTSGFTITNAGSGTGVSLTGSSNADTLIGGSGGDTIIGCNGGDTLTGRSGIDTFTSSSGGTGESIGTVGGSGDAGTLAGYDVITDFSSANDILNLDGSPFAVGNTTGTDGANSALTIGAQVVRSHAITNGIVTF